MKIEKKLDKTNKMVGRKLKELLDAKNIDAKDIAIIIDRNPNTITRYMNGKSAIPINRLIIIANYCEVPIGYFCDEALKVNGNGKIYTVVKLED